MSGDHLAARMGDMHERWDAMERHILEQFEEYARAYKLRLDKHEDETWASSKTAIACAAYTDGYICRHMEQAVAYDATSKRLTADNARLQSELAEAKAEAIAANRQVVVLANSDGKERLRKLLARHIDTPPNTPAWHDLRRETIEEIGR